MNSLFLFFILVYFGLFFDNMNIFKYCLVSSVFHEIRHIISYRYFIKKWPRIDVSIFGFRMQNDVSYNKYNIFILSAGPLINLFLVFLALFSNNIYPSLMWYSFASVNIIILILNVLPVYYLDGGQILYILSPFYQRNYIRISFFAIISTTVMLMYFTDLKAVIMVPLIYFIFNTLNDI